MGSFPLDQRLARTDEARRIVYHVSKRVLERPHVEQESAIIRSEFQLVLTAGEREIIGEIELGISISGRWTAGVRTGIIGYSSGEPIFPR
jgi:hypothetical protein